MKVKAFIERGNDGAYGIYIDLEENRLPFGIIGDGGTVEEAIRDFYNSKDEMKKLYDDTGKKFPVGLEFEFKYDTASFLSYYSKVLSLAGLSRLVGINQGQLSHYVNGRKKPTKKTIKKIEDSIHSFASELSQVQFV